MVRKFPEPKSAKQLLEEDIPLEHPEKAYRRGYRDAILILSQDNDVISRRRLYKIYEWAFDGGLSYWQHKIRDEEDPGTELPPHFPN